MSQEKSVNIDLAFMGSKYASQVPPMCGQIYKNYITSEIIKDYFE